jgi:hypothetical protein
VSITQWLGLGILGITIGVIIGLSLPANAGRARVPGTIPNKQVCVHLVGTINGTAIDAFRVMAVSNYLLFAEEGSWDIAAVVPRSTCP